MVVYYFLFHKSINICFFFVAMWQRFCCTNFVRFFTAVNFCDLYNKSTQYTSQNYSKVLLSGRGWHWKPRCAKLYALLWVLLPILNSKHHTESVFFFCPPSTPLKSTMLWYKLSMNMYFKILSDEMMGIAETFYRVKP